LLIAETPRDNRSELGSESFFSVAEIHEVA